MTETVIDGVQAIYIIEEAENIEEYNSVRIWVGDKEIANQDELKIVFYNDEKQNERDVEAEVIYRLLLMFVKIGIDRPESFDDIVDFIVDDIKETADPKDWHSGDIGIAFRRYLERQKK